MKHRVRKVVVLGAGTMGAQVAAHLVAQGLDVALLDMVPPGAADRSVLAKKALSTLGRLKPSPLHLPEHAAALRPGNFEDHWSELRDADWVFEAVVEDLEVKRSLLARVAAAIGPATLVTSNTSGLGIGAMSAHLPEDVQRRLFGTHFFNPPRYLRLLETIPGPRTDAGVLAAFEDFAERVAGKGVVRCKDTPNFIANRVGAYGFGSAMQAMVDLDLTIEEVDALTGPPVGRPRSATFRTADIAGVDVCLRVSENLFPLVPHDPHRETLRLPDFVKAMVQKGLLGEKSGGGFYRKEGRDIRTLDWKSLEYRERKKPELPSLDAAQSVADPIARVRQLMGGSDKAGQFLWRVLAGTCLYAASLIPEIADDVWSVDRAMEWGYGWALGPFRTLDALGPQWVAERAREKGPAVPAFLQALLDSGRKRFYDGVVAPPRPGVIDLPALKAARGVVKKNPGASLVDLGDGVALVEFHAKMNALGADAIGMLHSAVKEVRADFDALVVGNQGENFTVGANLMLVLMAAEEGEWDELGRSVRQFQDANMALKTAEFPVVAAPFGLSLGGGCEISLHAHRVRASAETYMGLVEVGVGVVPAGGGTKEMALRALDQCAGVDTDPFPFLKRAFETIAFAKVSTSGAEALRLYLTPADSLSANPDRLLLEAKELALGLFRAGHRAVRPRTDVPALGRPALATFKMALHNVRQGGRISEHDALVATKVASILCGGDRPPGTITEQELLDLEREAFLSLLGTKKTRERVAYMLKEGKPLRN
jgi:3-hydroxyacyl-CoA dehydrogenase